MLYVCENKGVYGLTKGQFSASADIGTKSKKGEENLQSPVDPCLAALSLGGTFIARSFSGDKEQLVPLIQAGLMHKGFAMIDIISPCVTFNDHAGSTKSYTFAREHYHEAVHADYIPPQREISVSYGEGEALPVPEDEDAVEDTRAVEEAEELDRVSTISKEDIKGNQEILTKPQQAEDSTMDRTACPTQSSITRIGGIVGAMDTMWTMTVLTVPTPEPAT